MIGNLQLLTFVVFVPALGAILLAFFPKNNHEGMRIFTLVVTVLVLVPVLWMALPGGSPLQFDISVGGMQSDFRLEWIPSFDIYYFMGMDGISFPLVQELLLSRKPMTP